MFKLFSSRSKDSPQSRCAHPRGKDARFCSVALDSYSPPVLEIMAKAGWYCGRCVAMEPHSSIPKQIRPWLTEFAGLNFLSPTGLQVYPLSWQRGADHKKFIERLRALIGFPVFLFGSTTAFCDTSDLFIDGEGQIYFVDSESSEGGSRYLYRIAASTNEALQSMLCGDVLRRFKEGLMPRWEVPLSVLNDQ